MHLSFINDKSPSRIIKTKQGCEIKLKRMTESEKYIRKSALSSYEATRPTISSLLRPNRMVEIGKCNLVLVPSERYLINGKVDGGLNEQWLELSPNVRCYLDAVVVNLFYHIRRLKFCRN
ncbi:9191_t:CDS:2 [Dentiscutata erythropus]|uniref:9191_t:CDS:1 n=1 Tax=Dentiscutata erythropus TaxID=1348616 RepID=A0A9N9H2Z4_9GLOM|nr:9191_t:CDS:2 [Dentiscutata erythropus]